MDGSSLNVQAAVVYARYLEVLKVILSFQEYVLRKYFGTGLVARFPSIVMHPLNYGKVGYSLDEKTNTFHIHPYGKSTETVGAYIDMYVGLLEGDLIGRHKRAVQLDRFKDANTDWRSFTDLLFTKMIKYVNEQE
jgi:hypothetical protein